MRDSCDENIPCHELSDEGLLVKIGSIGVSGNRMTTSPEDPGSVGAPSTRAIVRRLPREIPTATLRPGATWSAAERSAVCEWLCDEKHGELLRFARRMVRDFHLAEDVTQQFFTNLLASRVNLARFNPEFRPFWPTYIKRCFRNFVLEELDRVRGEKDLARPTAVKEDIDLSASARRVHSRSDAAFSLPRGHQWPIETLAEEERCREHILRCLAELEEIYQQAWVLIEFEGWSAVELASVLVLTEDTIRQRARRARDQMAKCVSQRYETAST
jgi:RNA polymerase sigma factor (sigma-70 family)